MRKKLRGVFVLLGCLCFISAVSLAVYNKVDSERATRESGQLTENLSALLVENVADVSLENGEDAELEQIDDGSDEATVSVGGYEVSGMISIPAINIDLAVINDWSYPNLAISACRYSGSPEDQMILLAHNYQGHFGRLDQLIEGDEVRFTNAEGVVFNYTVTNTELWASGQLNEIISGDAWDLTLFTCTFDGNDRIVVRCVESES